MAAKPLPPHHSSNDAQILDEAERHSRRLGKVATAAGNVWWKQVDATRDVRNASGTAARHEALVRLAALHASYGDAPLGSLDAAEILREATRHSRRLGKAATDASNASWKHDDAMRDVRNNHGGQERREALARLAALNASYGGAAVDAPAAVSRLGAGVWAINSTLAGSATALDR